MKYGFEIIDSHCHIYPEKIAEKAVGGTDHFYGSCSVCRGTVEDVLLRGTEVGYDRFVVQSVATTPKQVGAINRFIGEAMAENKGRLTGLGALHPESADMVADVRQIVEFGLHGVKLHPDFQQFRIDDISCRKMYELCEQEELPILMHMGDKRYDYSHPDRLVPVLKAFPGLRIVGAHMGGWSVWEDACQTLMGFENLYVDTSSSLLCAGREKGPTGGIAYLTEEQARNMIHSYGVDRVLYGTDYPMWSPKSELDAFFALGLSREENRKILSENARKLWGI